MSKESNFDMVVIIVLILVAGIGTVYVITKKNGNNNLIEQAYS